MKINIINKNILITGATGGIGKALVKSFDSEDNKILLTGTNDTKLKSMKYVQNLTKIANLYYKK